ncbi:transcription-repair coupling factor [Nicoliella spurrieriana]|uniref:Transcription-repair-coupling factor n=1 Tax=Nicoliella spurrieriana TaxID=2925830 RepID=A0A976RSH8_9LACO|nr:transcription-repair coupling factor [Nicoliella spurrieriana]UQS87048.1 transcription-repair coupling factor [Nicoliella spurrieriana]
MKLSQFFTSIPQFQTITDNLKPATRQLITGMSGSAKTLLLSILLEQTKQPILLVVDNLHHMTQVADDFTNLLSENQVFEFPAEELIAAEAATSSPQYRAQRVRALHALQTKQAAVVVTSMSGVRRLLPTPHDFAENQFQITVGDEIDLGDVKTALFRLGYRRVKLVAAPGEFAIRGSIIDIYPLNSEYPIRVDLFDTEVDSLRYFDVSTQSSVQNMDSFKVLPATDFILNADQLQNGPQQLQTHLNRSVGQIKDAKVAEAMKDYLQPIIDEFKAGIIDSQLILFANYLFDRSTSIFDYVPSDGIIVCDDYHRLLESEQELLGDEQQWAADKLLNGEIFSDQQFGHDFKTVFKAANQPELMFARFQRGLNGLRLTKLVEIKVQPMQKFYGQIPLLKTEMNRWQKQNETVVIMVRDKVQMDKLANTMDDFEINVTQTDWDHLIQNQVQLIPERLNNGFELPFANLALITESEMFNHVTKRLAKRQTFSNAERIKSYVDLKPGDYVVHVNHGIGRYEGMKTMEVDGKHQDYMTITYRDNAQLFIPVTQLNLIQKYVSAEDKRPRINKLGGSEWAKTKSKVASKIEDIADDLIDLYAKRSTATGFAFPPDDVYQEQFDDAFPYPETPDQIKSINEIKVDMEKPHPMDRLLVGDVGYGKTEVALRAAFKAIEAGKQVAFLVPTTVLAHQHYETILKRFDGFPVSAAVLSRFRTPKQIKTTIKGLEDESIDIVVGTHRLLSKDVHFKDLGLLIVDEEQRFGVKHKERIKEMRSDVDVLTLTATPIPRTLNMSMMGVRDLSVIETPPTNRYPIQTYVLEENAGTIKDGIHRELDRGGQVFYLHNRVEDIEKTVGMLEQLVPDARIAYIHGKMSENQLETVLYDFVNGDYDVLVTTTIIETGVDIPNANTLFVENSDHMGLSQLYQLRGRIGRSNRIAYAYFMYKPNKVLTEVSENRLDAIRDFTALGSGFKIAMRDLSLRGAGNLLGKQQHGFVDSVGYDLYTEMLSDAVAQKRGTSRTQRVDSTIELDVEAYLPDDYISDHQQKIEIYKRIRQLENEDQYTEIQGDLIDRFGDYPVAVANLLLIGRMKMLADQALIKKISNDAKAIIITMSKLGTTVFDSKDILRAIAQTKFRSTLEVVNDRIQIKLIIQPTMQQAVWLNELMQLIDSLVHRRMEIEDEK